MLPDLSDLLTHQTDHYIFHYHPDSPAQRDILAIAQEQETCFARITAELGVTPEKSLRYILCNSPEECAGFWRTLFNDATYEALNGFADCPIAIYAVYNDEIQCIGPHEDAHFIASLIDTPWEMFLTEGLAMYFDGVWWSEDNILWVRRFLADGRYVPIRELIDNDRFNAVPCEVSYPIAGAFTRYAVEKLGMQRYLTGVYAAEEDAAPCLERLLGKPLPAIEQDFLAWIQA